MALDLEPRGAGADRQLIGQLDAAEVGEPPQIEDAGGRRAMVRVDHQIGAAGEHHPVGMGGAGGQRLVEIAGA